MKKRFCRNRNKNGARCNGRINHSIVIPVKKRLRKLIAGCPCSVCGLLHCFKTGRVAIDFDMGRIYYKPKPKKVEVKRSVYWDPKKGGYQYGKVN